jgi:hypothetical protein
MVKCNSPRPETRKLSVSVVSSTRSAILVSSSLRRRSRIWPTGHELAFGAGVGRVVDHEGHVQRRFVDLEHRQRFGLALRK